MDRGSLRHPKLLKEALSKSRIEPQQAGPPLHSFFFFFLITMVVVEKHGNKVLPEKPLSDSPNGQPNGRNNII